jgi:hypothetical protein
MREGLALVATELRRIGYSGPFGIDSWRHRAPAGLELHVLGEVNARLTFGIVAAGLVERLRRAGVLPAGAPASLCAGPEPRGGGLRVPLLHEAPDDPLALWIEAGGGTA